MNHHDILMGKVYKHYGGGRYTVLAISEESTNSRNGMLAVVYVSLTHCKIRHRGLVEFQEEVLWPDGIKRPRFILEDQVS